MHLEKTSTYTSQLHIIYENESQSNRTIKVLGDNLGEY